MSNNIMDNLKGDVKIPDINKDLVYKSENVFGFENPEFDDGIYVNLSTFQSYSKAYAIMKCSNEKPVLYLNIKTTKTKKEENKNEVKKEVTKLGIGIDGGFQTNDDVYDYDTKYYLVSYPSGYTISYPNKDLPSNINECVEGIINQDDASKLRELKPWVEERQVSKFAKDLPQLDNGKKISPNPSDWKCEESGMTENLWLNLSTGHIGSGRKNWDGTGGTGAALKHFEETGNKYPLAVKLGTITPNGADVFSYDPSENDMVEDPYLAEHLAHWGINMMKMQKTEKTMAELSIDLNLRYEFDAIQESGKELEALHGAGLMGLRNLGNSCYMNSLFQVLFSISEVQERYVSKAEFIFKHEPKNPAQSLEIQLAKLGVALCTDRYTKNVPDDFIISPQMLRTAIGRNHSEFSSNRQQDVFEYYQYVLELIEREDRALPYDIKSICNLFKFTFEERLECLQSNQVRYTSRSGSNALCLEIPLHAIENSDEIEAYYSKNGDDNNKRTKLCDATGPAGIIKFEKCIENFLLPRESDGFLSPVTNKRGKASILTRIQKFPKYLMIQMRRYILGDDWTPKKLNVDVEMPLEFDFKDLKSQGLKENEVEMKENQQVQQQPQQVEADVELVTQLMAFGMFSENGCRRAVIATNNAGVENAVNWGLEHMNDADFNNDPTVNVGASVSTPSSAVNPESVMMLQSMGFTTKQSEHALKETNGDLDRAANWLFSRIDQLDALIKDEAKVENSSNESNNNDHGSTQYELMAIISHMGPSTQVGHYVCHVKKGNDWVIFNDRKVARSEQPPFGLGFLYLYKQKN